MRKRVRGDVEGEKEKEKERDAVENERATETKWRSAAGCYRARWESRGELRGTKRERRALHFIAAASSLFIADTTLRHISSVFPAGTRATCAGERKKSPILVTTLLERERERERDSRAEKRPTGQVRVETA